MPPGSTAPLARAGDTILGRGQDLRFSRARAGAIVANLNSGSFLNRWQIIQRATMPALDCHHWRVDHVEWRRQRHVFSGVGYSFALEVHSLISPGPGKPWSLMVVVEHWWASDKKPVKTLTWARRLAGNSTAIFSWARSHEAVRRATGATD